MEIQYFSQINREDIGRPRGKFPSAWPSWKKPSTISKLHANPPRASLITIHRRMEGNKERKEGNGGGKKEIFLIIHARSPSIYPRLYRHPPLSGGSVGGWIPSLSSRTPILQTGKLLFRPQNPSTERAYFHLTRLNDRLILLKTPVTWFHPFPLPPRVQIFPPDAFIAIPPPRLRNFFQKLDEVWRSLEGSSLDHWDEEF